MPYGFTNDEIGKAVRESLDRLKAKEKPKREWRPRWMAPPTQHPTRTCRAVLRALRAAGCEIEGPDEHWRITNLRTGHWQRSEGAWSWALDWAGPETRPTHYGGYWPASECGRPGATIHQGPGGISLDPPGK